MAKKKKEKKPKEPQYYESATNTKVLNYRVYYMNWFEKIGYFLAAFAVGALVGYLFYGGIGADEFGNPTKKTYIINAIVMGATGLAAGYAYLPIRTEQIIKKRKNMLRQQFRELLDSLSTSLGSGKNVTDSFVAAVEDLKAIYEEDAFILHELSVIVTGLSNNISIESMLMDFGKRSDNADIKSFATIFETCYRKGGNIKDVVRNTYQIISEKMEIELEIETIVTSNKMEQKVMTIMPIALVGIIKFMSPEFAANFTTTIGIISTTFAVGLFVASYFVAKVVLDIKV